MDVMVFPTFLDLARCIAAGLQTGGQCGHAEATGAHTGDVSMQMLKAAGCSSVLCGHSERRSAHGETDAFVALQAQAALNAGLTPIVCVGESLAEREAGKEQDVVRRQISAIPPGVTIIAYEPVWAIGTGKNASPQQAQEMHAFIRSLVKGRAVRLLYGGSLNVKNARDLLAQPDIDGGLLGGASLKPGDFGGILSFAQELGR